MVELVPERWSYIVAVPTLTADDPEFWRFLESGTPNPGDEMTRDEAFALLSKIKSRDLERGANTLLDAGHDDPYQAVVWSREFQEQRILKEIIEDRNKKALQSKTPGAEA